MKAYLPAKFLQVMLHHKGGDPARLDDLLDLLRELSFEPVVGIDLRDVSSWGLLLLPTRRLKCPFEQEELDRVVNFVSQGNPLFHLSNHSPLTEQDSCLGRLFGYRFHSIVRGSDRAGNLNVDPTSHCNPVFDTSIHDLHFTIHNSSIVSPDDSSFCVIADFSRSDLSCGDPSGAFAIARPRTQDMGAIVALGDSGLLGKPMMPKNPGPGLRAGDNRELVKRILGWLKTQSVECVEEKT
jgi:hypothetical protein